MIVIVFVYQLKVFDTRFIYSAIEVKYEGLDLLVPLRWLVKEEHDPLCIVNLKLLLDRLIFLQVNKIKYALSNKDSRPRRTAVSSYGW